MANNTTDVIVSVDTYFNGIVFRDNEGLLHIYSPMPLKLEEMSKEYVKEVRNLYGTKLVVKK